MAPLPLGILLEYRADIQDKVCEVLTDTKPPCVCVHVHVKFGNELYILMGIALYYAEYAILTRWSDAQYCGHSASKSLQDITVLSRERVPVS